VTEALPTLPQRAVDGHKGTFGTVMVIGGQAAAARMMIGGPAFTALAALRTGAGLAVLAMPAPILHDGLTIAPSATGLALPVDDSGALIASEAAACIDQTRNNLRCVAIGPGLGMGTPQQQLVVWLLSRDDTPAVIDADAINVMAQTTDALKDLRAPAVFTPHPGEFRRLADTLGIDLDPTVDVQREPAAEALAQRLGAVVVLKGHRTVISDGVRTAVNDTGGPVLATAGTGDVLAGVIAGLIAQFVHPFMPGGTPDTLGLFECAHLGVWLHGRAADRWTSRFGAAGLLATDLIEELPSCLHELRGRTP
jgi:NAD(P)H-hydrate epimerase